MSHVRLIKLSWRNVWRNRRRSLITIAAISFSIVIVALMRSLQYGTYDAMESLAVSLFHGEIQIQRQGFQEEQTLEYAFDGNAHDWHGLVHLYPEITAVSQRVTGFGLVSSDSSSAGALLVGIEPEYESKITRFSTMLAAGETLQTRDDHQVLLGASLAKNLRVDVGDTISVLTQGYHNELGADLYRIKGLLKLGNAELDRSLLVMTLENAQEIFSLYNQITQVVLHTNDFRKANAVANKIAQNLDAQYAVLPWEKLMPELKQIILLDNISGAIYLVFLLLVVGFEIFNTTMMSLMERIREFGLLQSLGMKPVQIGNHLLMESLIKIFLALIMGLFVAMVLVSILSHHPIPLSEKIREGYASYGLVIENMKFSTKSRIYLEPVVAITLIALMAIIYPIIKTIKLTPVEALRKT